MRLDLEGAESRETEYEVGKERVYQYENTLL